MTVKADSMERPYVGLIPFREEDARYFFGREKEQEIITGNLLASRLTLLYGASGVGKSSVLRAGVAHHLRQLAEGQMARRGKPKFVVVVFNSWSDDPLAGTLKRIEEAVAQMFAGQTFEPVSPALGFVEKLQEWSRRIQAQLLIIYDQFEEYFLYHPNEQGAGTFASEFPRAVNTPGLPVNFIVSYREDSHAKLDFFKGSIPELYENYFRIEHLNAEAARAAIVRPIEQYNQRHEGDGQPPMSIEPLLVEAVLAQVEAGQVVLGEAGQGVVKAGASKSQVETPYLQLVMTRLWDEEMRAGSRKLRLKTLEDLGGADKIVRSHLDETMAALPTAEQDTAASVFHYLVTPSGSKIAHSARDLAEYAKLSLPTLEPVLKKLGDLRILRSIEPPPDQPNILRYEIFHDVLAAAILDWRARYAQKKMQAEAEQQAEEERRRIQEQARIAEQSRVAGRLRTLAAALAFMTLLMSGVAVFAYSQRTRAVANEREAIAQRKLAEEQRNLAEEKARAVTASEKKTLAAKDEAEKQRQLAEVEKAKAIEASQRADAERAKAVAASERADSEAQVARMQAHEAEVAKAEAVKQKGLAEEQRTRAEEQRTRADALARESFSREVAAAASNKLNSDPELSVLLALHGLKGKMSGEESNDNSAPASETQPGGAPRKQVVTKEAEDALHQAVQASRVRHTLGHDAAANRVAFSPDGRHAATASAEGSVKLWDASAGDEVLTIAASGSDIQGLTFSPDGKLLAASRDGGTISVWETESGNEVHSITEGLGAIKTLAFSPDSKWLAVAANKKQGRLSRFSPFLLNSATGEAAALPYANNQPRQDTTLTFSDDGQTLTMGSCLIKGSNRCTSFEVVSWDVKTQQAKETRPVLVSEPPASSAVDAAFSLQTMRVAAIYQTGQTKLFDAATGKEIRTFNEKIRDDVGWLVAISPRGGYVTAYGDDGTVKMWDAEDGTLLVDQIPTTKSTSERETSKREENVSEDEGPRNSAGVTAKALFNSDGSRLATFASWDNTVHVWDTQTGDEMATLTGHTGGVYRVAFSPDNQQLLTASADKTVKVWDIAPSRELLTIKGDWSEIVGLAYSPDGKSLAGAGDDGKARVWSVADGHEEHALAAGEGRVLGIAYSRDGRFMATGHRDGVARLWDAASGKFLRNLNPPPKRSYAELWDVAFSPDGQRVVIGSSSGEVIVSETATGKELFELHDAHMYDEKEKAAAAAEKVEAPAHAGGVFRVAFSPDDKLIATASADTTVKLWDAAGGKRLSTLTGHTDEVWDVAFSSDSKRLASASHDRTAQIWDITKTTDGLLTPSVVLTLSGHTRWLWCVAFSPDDKRIATGSSDNTTKLWDAATGEELLTLAGHTKAVNRIAFSPDGKHLATSSEDGAIREYTLDIEELKRLARARVSRDTFTRSENVKYLHIKPVREPK